MVLLLKLTLVPTLILLVSLAGARWGARVAGMLAGFPIVAGPILLLLFWEHGPDFAGRSAQATLYGLLALLAYCLSFCWLALHRPWWLCLLGGWLVFAGVASLVQWLPQNLPLAAVLSVLAIVAAPRAFPVLPTSQDIQPLARTELLWRLLAATGLVLGLTTLARTLGETLAGVLTPFPVAGSVLGVFALRAGGAAQAIALLRSMSIGLIGLWLFFVVVASGLQHGAGGSAFVLALIAALALQAGLLWWRSR